jgi:hypothetical protein
VIVEYTVAPGSVQRVKLERQLLVCGRDARIANQRHMMPDPVRFPVDISADWHIFIRAK